MRAVSKSVRIGNMLRYLSRKGKNSLIWFTKKATLLKRLLKFWASTSPPPAWLCVSMKEMAHSLRKRLKRPGELKLRRQFKSIAKKLKKKPKRFLHLKILSPRSSECPLNYACLPLWCSRPRSNDQRFHLIFVHQLPIDLSLIKRSKFPSH